MDPFAKRRISQTDLEVTQFGFGAGILGDPWEVIDEATADATIDAAYNAGVTHFDTAPWYGNTKSEHRTGHALGTKPRDSYTLSTKVGRVYSRPENPATFHHPRWLGGLPFALRFDYGRDAVLRSYEDSLMRLGINTVDCLVIHDLDFKFHQTEEGVAGRFSELADGGGFRALDELRTSGEIRAIGAGVNHLGMIPRFLDRFEIDFFLVAMPYTLLDQSALEEEFPRCQERGVSIIIGAVFASGILATGAVEGARYAYVGAASEMIEKTAKIEAVCGRHAVPLRAAAVQFPLGHDAVVAVIPGANSPQQVEENLRNLQIDIPSQFWAELKEEGLLRADAPVPHPGEGN